MGALMINIINSQPQRADRHASLPKGPGSRQHSWTTDVGAPRSGRDLPLRTDPDLTPPLAPS